MEHDGYVYTVYIYNYIMGCNEQNWNMMDTHW